MIATGKVSEGCQLLCLINKALDACRYMQTYGQWHQASWLAKSTLSEEDSSHVLKRYVDHLCSANVNLKSYAILVRKCLCIAITFQCSFLSMASDILICLLFCSCFRFC